MYLIENITSDPLAMSQVFYYEDTYFTDPEPRELYYDWYYNTYYDWWYGTTYDWDDYYDYYEEVWEDYYEAVEDYYDALIDYYNSYGFS